MELVINYLANAHNWLKARKLYLLFVSCWFITEEKAAKKPKSILKNAIPLAGYSSSSDEEDDESLSAAVPVTQKSASTSSQRVSSNGASTSSGLPAGIYNSASYFFYWHRILTDLVVGRWGISMTLIKKITVAVRLLITTLLYHYIRNLRFTMCSPAVKALLNQGVGTRNSGRLVQVNLLLYSIVALSRQVKSDRSIT